ncbi:hypothetical protein HYFRA_00011220 [Hymenoscyphus fraxineus]|uniref:Uncharacterized protein n=1 Tax=Hymenoscyphus fraxineus TaxID=746836 RepID=A0A9N9KZC0_9HELO|nr:hypothetical protein HYFRA_00011220 [Hymenoscyphus fraxineus]
MTELHLKAQSLVRDICQDRGNLFAVNSITPSLYDTAWVSMLRKHNDTSNKILFPECFQYVLDLQVYGGGWEEPHDSVVDTIVKSLAGLLALKRNSKEHDPLVSDMKYRIEGATGFLKEKLAQWDVTRNLRPGVSLIVPAMLGYLEEEGIFFEFSGSKLLMELNQKKLAKVPSSIYHVKKQTTFTFVLEAFIGKGDFALLREVLVEGSMGGIPSSTAAFLMGSSVWVDEVEDYLRRLIILTTGDTFRGLPHFSPITGFEALWIIFTFLNCGFDVETLPELMGALDIIEHYYEASGGLAAKLHVMDADSTARSISIRNMLGKPTDPDALTKAFMGPENFCTYEMELICSLSTNCNVLTALLLCPNPEAYALPIEKCLRYICDVWLNFGWELSDKWNTSEYYPIMLISEALMLLVNLWETSLFSLLPVDLVTRILPTTVFQLLLQILQRQNEDGSWGSHSYGETTAYAILALASLSSLPVSLEVSGQVLTAIESARTFLKLHDSDPHKEQVWSGKTRYSVVLVSEAYVVAAMSATFPKFKLEPKLQEVWNTSIDQK